VHTPEFLTFLKNIYDLYCAVRGKAVPALPETFANRITRFHSRHPVAQMGHYGFGIGSPVLSGTWEAAYWSAQCAINAAEIVRSGSSAAYAVCRPPGHHAAADLYGGFCYLNNAAIAAAYLNTRVAILDIDYHHGNGTQEIFYANPEVLYCSLHADPEFEYPYFWGSASETGAGGALGANCNWPLPLGTGDSEYLSALDQAIETIARFSPRYLVVSVGLDIADQDPVGGFRITLAGMQEIGQRIAGLQLPTVLVQEGGYLLENLGENAIALTSAFAGG
jgi:acetoin utilization deacetylase AcuC-like enzyme